MSVTFRNRAEIVIEAFGWRVFPVGRDKVPCIKGGCNAASRDPEIIAGWGQQFPEANVAVPTGAESGIFVIDCDRDDALERLRRLGRLPDTLIARSHRGVHLYFLHCGGRVVNRSGKLVERSSSRYRSDRWVEIEGLDIRGDGGSITVPPSVHASGREYQWIDAGVPIALPPPWLLRMLGEKREALLRPDFERQPPSLDGIVERLERAGEGTRNHALNVAAFQAGKCVRERMCSENEASGQLVYTALNLGLTRHEALATIRSGLRAGYARAR